MAAATESWDVLPIGLCVVDDSLEVIQINGSMKQILSSRDKLKLPLTIRSMHGEFAASMTPVIGRVLKSRRPEENVEAVLYRATESRHLLVTAFPLGACPRNSAQRTREPNLLRSTNSSRNAGTRRAGEQKRYRTSAAADFDEKHPPMPLSEVAWLREGVGCYASGTPGPTRLLLCLFRVARIGETRGLV